MIRPPPRPSLTYTLCPYTSRFRSTVNDEAIAPVRQSGDDLVKARHQQHFLETVTRTSERVGCVFTADGHILLFFHAPDPGHGAVGVRPIHHDIKEELGRAPVSTPVTNAPRVCSILF